MNQIISYLTDDDFAAQVLNVVNNENNRLFLVDFWAEWCNPCKIIAPILEEIAIEFDINKLKIVKLNIDKSPITTKNYGIRSIPTLLLIRNGIVLDTKVGLLSKQQLQELINSYL